ncbi:MAG: excinuclease ABC subunit B, partial [Proteobacteria bacterium]|nr:excinuclease ABC subunit B [Pseudomonadota bacterium]
MALAEGLSYLGGVRRDPEQIPFSLESKYSPRGDQPAAIRSLDENIRHNVRFQTLLGVTGSGKTFTVANVIAKQNRPVLVIAPNKTLAAQLYAEFKEFFPKDRVRYFVSYYDYYQPEAYVPSTDTYIEKDASINEEIDKLRHSATRSILEARNTIVVASVSCIYGLGAPEEYFNMMLFLEAGQVISREEVIQKLVFMQYTRSDFEFGRGNFRVMGETVDIFPSDEDSKALRILFFGDEIETITEIDSISGAALRPLPNCMAYPVSHYVTSREAVEKAVVAIKAELKDWLIRMRNDGKGLEAQRLEQRTMYDLELMQEIGVVREEMGY